MAAYINLLLLRVKHCSDSNQLLDKSIAAISGGCFEAVKPNARVAKVKQCTHCGFATGGGVGLNGCVYETFGTSK